MITALTSILSLILMPTPGKAQARAPIDPCSIVLAVQGDAEVERPQAKVRSASRPGAQLERLGWAFVRLARERNDPGYFTLGRQTALCMQRHTPDDPAAMLLEAHALHSLHRFREAEVLARHLAGQRGRWFDHALLGDVLMEQGDLDGAVASYQRAMDLRPGPQLYTRAAHVRWLKGDVAGAVVMMRAAAAGIGGRDRESAAWTYTRLATYELQRGKLAEALRWADAALDLQIDSAAALYARGRVLLALGETMEATASLEQAARANPLPEYRWALADALAADGRGDEARRAETELVAGGGADDPRSFALYLATRDQNPSTAIRLARQELEARRDVFTYDALAWALLAAGQPQAAYDNMRRAVGEGTQDARLFLHAALIAAAVGRQDEAAAWHRRARPLVHMLLPSERALLADFEPRITNDHEQKEET